MVQLWEAFGRASVSYKKMQWYLFGSFLTASHPADIDLLIVCGESTDTLRLRNELADLCRTLPVHLLIMTSEEEAELGFVLAENCQLLASLS